MSSRDEDRSILAWIALLAIGGFAGAVVLNYYLWNWLLPIFGWSEIGFWWYVPITLGMLLIKLLGHGLYFLLFAR